MSKYQVTTENGVYEVETADSAPSLAEKATSAVTNFAKGTAKLPLNFPKVQAEMMKDVLQTGIEADKKYPAENLLPAVGSTVGAIVGGAATLPSGAGVPFGGTVGAGVGGALGEKARQGARYLRGKEQDEGSALKEGLLGATSELGGAAVFKVLRGFFTGKIARGGIKTFVDKVTDIINPKQLDEANKAFEVIKSNPVSTTSDTLETVEKFLENRGINYKASAEALRRKMQSEAMGSKQGMEISQELIEASSPKLVSDLKTPLLNEYKPMANILDDLSNPELNYGQMKQIQETVGDLANFGKRERSIAEKTYGKIYNSITKDLERTAKEGGFEELHKLVSDQRRKVVQSRIFKDLIDESKVADAAGERLDFSLLSKNLDMTENEIRRIFGKDADTVLTLRDLSNEYAKRFPNKDLIHPYISGTGNIGATGRVSHLIERLKSPVAPLEQISRRRLGTSELAKKVYPTAEPVRNIRRGLSQGVGLSLSEILNGERR